MYEEILNGLRQEIAAEGARPHVIDKAVSELLTISNDKLAPNLLGLLSDNAQSDEGMFTLIHAAESVEDATYVSALVTMFPKLVSRAPRWASIVLMRVLNNPETQQLLTAQLRSSSDTVKMSFAEMCHRIGEVSPQFLKLTAPVVLAVS